jgi:hypothetical protein
MTNAECARVEEKISYSDGCDEAPTETSPSRETGFNFARESEQCTTSNRAKSLDRVILERRVIFIERLAIAWN